jgi:beta-glucosidase
MPPTNLRVSRLASSLLALAVAVAAASAAVAAPPNDASTPAVVDSQAFLGVHLPPAAAGAPHRPPRLSKRVADLLARMTLREKVGQMTQLTVAVVASGRDQELRMDPVKLQHAVGDYGVGSILNVSDQALPLERWHEVLRDIQAAAAKTRLRIPVLYGIDTIHGANYVRGATLFPQPLGMAATWNPELMLAGSRVAAGETRAAGIPWNFSPVLDVGRQPLWPRLYETFGEDAYLGSVMGVAAVRGYQGDGAPNNLASPRAVAATLKHYVGYSYPTTGHDRTPALIPELVLREHFLPPFAAAVRAGAAAVMVNSGEVNGTPGHVNGFLL